METEEALRKQLIFQDETESLEGALNALIETRVRLDAYYKNYRGLLEKAKVIQRLVQDTEVLVRYDVPADKIPAERTLREMDSFIKELGEIMEL